MSKTAITLLATFAVTVLLFSGSAAQTGIIQPQAIQPSTLCRFQIAAFDYRADASGSCGAYILDTQNGEVFQVVGKSPPEMLGSVEIARKKKADH